MKDEKLKPCPFCGANGSLDHEGSIGWWAYCDNPVWEDCLSPKTRLHDRAKDAIAAWNRRAK